MEPMRTDVLIPGERERDWLCFSTKAVEMCFVYVAFDPVLPIPMVACECAFDCHLR